MPIAVRARTGRFVAWAALLFAACSSPPSPSGPAPHVEPGAPAEPMPGAAPAGPALGPEPARDPVTRCLPVVAAECGCVYPCGTGTSRGDGRWDVQHASWPGSTLDARIDRWCVGGACTEAFFAELPCSVICAPRAADPSCHLADGECVGAH